jgi:hypothetical protein
MSLKHVFCAPELVGTSKSDLRRLVELPPAPVALAAVK